MYKIKNKIIYVNRGDKITIHLVNNSDTFRIGDYITFYICKENDLREVLLEKRFNINENTDSVDLDFTSEEMKIGEPLKSQPKTYWYEIELNGNTTLVGYDNDGPKLLILYPEAISSEEGGSI